MRIAPIELSEQRISYCWNLKHLCVPSMHCILNTLGVYYCYWFVFYFIKTPRDLTCAMSSKYIWRKNAVALPATWFGAPPMAKHSLLQTVSFWSRWVWNKWDLLAATITNNVEADSIASVPMQVSFSNTSFFIQYFFLHFLWRWRPLSLYIYLYIYTYIFTQFSTLYW